MKELQWRNDQDFEIEGVQFHCSLGNYSEKTESERFVLLKDRGSLDQYAKMFANDPPKNVLEFGIFQGGSPALFSLWFDLDRFVGIDICEPVPAFDEFCRTHPLHTKISCHYRVSQTDRVLIQEIAASEFGSAPIDLIIDDASHRYGHSRSTFETAFPLLCPGGTYVIEDWSWAHWPVSQPQYDGQTPLSTLVMELIMLCASRSDLISEVRLFPGCVFVRKAARAPTVAEFELNGLYLKRGLEIVGTQNLNLAGVARLLASRMRQRMRRTKEKLQRAVHKRQAEKHRRSNRP